MYPNDDVHYAQGRLIGTIIRHNNKTVEVTGVLFVSKKQPLQVQAIEVLTGEPVIDSIDNFDLEPVPLGFVNLGYKDARNIKDVFYIARQAIRQDWRQGFRKANSLILYNENKYPRAWDNKCIARTIEGDFPTVEEVQANLKKDGEMQAWCREFALDNKNNIFYRTYGKIGELVKGTRDILLDAKYGWAEEALRESLK